MERIMEKEIDELKTYADLVGEGDEKEPEAKPDETAKTDETDAKPEEKPAETAETSEKVEENGTKGAENANLDFGKEGHTPKGVQQRINELSKGRREDREEIARLKARLEKYEKAQPQPKEKTRNDFPDDQSWIEYLADKKSDEKFNSRIREWEFNKEMESARPMMEKHEEEARAMLPDFDDVMGQQVDLPVDKDTYLFVAKSEKSAMINYTLRKVPSIREQFIKAPIEKRIDVVKAIEKRLFEIDKEVAEKKKNAPAPTAAPAETKPSNEVPFPAQKPQTPALRQPMDVKHNASGRPDPATCSMEEWMEYNN